MMRLCNFVALVAILPGIVGQVDPLAPGGYIIRLWDFRLAFADTTIRLRDQMLGEYKMGQQMLWGPQLLVQRVRVPKCS